MVAADGDVRTAVTGSELDLLEGGANGDAVFGPGERVEAAMLWENARTNNGRSMRPWAAFVITGNADYVSNLAVRAQLRARGITGGPMRYQRYYQLEVPR